MVINTKGQIVIPKALRDRFGIRPGQEVELREDKGKLVLVKTGLKDKFKALAQKYKYRWPKGVKNTTQLLKALRG
jgi:AbrB family looped-hinge helix DNA binding protein